MIAQQTLSVFDDLLAHLPGMAPSDTLNTDPQPYDEALEDDPAFAFLTDEALPEDPSKAAIVGVIDDAIPFAHQQFRLGRASRIASVWFQDVPPDPAGLLGADLPLGREYRGAQITDWLDQLADGTLVDEDALYRAAGVIDFRRQSPQRLAFGDGHGAAVSGLAAGFGQKDAAIARKLPIIGVCLPPYVVRDTLGTAAPFYILLATLHIIHRARRLCRYIERRQGRPKGSVRLPVIINLSFGLTAGAKDGSSDLERYLDAVSRQTASDLGPVRFVVAIGNHRLTRTQAHVAANASEFLQWQIRPDDMTPSFMEIWGPRYPDRTPPATPMQIECTLPGRAEPLRTEFKEYGTYQKLMVKPAKVEGQKAEGEEDEGEEVARAYLQRRAFKGEIREFVTLVVPATRPENLYKFAGVPGYGAPGRWGVKVLSESGGDFDVFLQRDDSVPGFGLQRGRQSQLIDEADPVFSDDGRVILYDPSDKTHGVFRAGTINAFACGEHPIRVGGIFADTGAMVPYSSLGPDPGLANFEGDVLAPAAKNPNWRAVAVIGTKSGARKSMSGTSMAAPAVTRRLALAFANGETIGPDRDAISAFLNAG